MNKNLIAQFIASVNVNELPTSAFRLNELDEFEIREVVEQSIAFKHDEHTIYAIPGLKNGKYVIDCYVMKEDMLLKSDYTLSWKKLSDILEEKAWNGNWVRPSRVEKVMKYIDWSN